MPTKPLKDQARAIVADFLLDKLTQSGKFYDFADCICKSGFMGHSTSILYQEVRCTRILYLPLPRWIFTLMKSGLRNCLGGQNRHHRCIDSSRNRRLVRIDSRHSKPFLPEKLRYFRAFFENMKKRSRNA